MLFNSYGLFSSLSTDELRLLTLSSSMKVRAGDQMEAGSVHKEVVRAGIQVHKEVVRAGIQVRRRADSSRENNSRARVVEVGVESSSGNLVVVVDWAAKKVVAVEVGYSLAQAEGSSGNLVLETGYSLVEAEDSLGLGNLGFVEGID